MTRIHRLSTGSVAAGGSKEDSWASDGDYKLKKIILTPRGNTPMSNVQLMADIGGVPFFRPDIPGDILDADSNNNPELNHNLPDGAKLNYKLTNSTGSAETYDIALILECAKWPPS